MDYIDELRENWQRLWSIKSLKRWSNIKFERRRRTRRFLTNYFNWFHEKGEDPPIVAFGNGRWPRPRGRQSMPVVKLFQTCAQHFETKVVDEFRTSSFCHHCSTQLHIVTEPKKKKKQEEYSRVNSGLVYCSQCKKVRDRDENAAHNILACAILEERPEHLTRGPALVRETIGIEELLGITSSQRWLPDPAPTDRSFWEEED